MGYIDRSGNWVIAPKFKFVGSFFGNGLACVVNENELLGYINKEGEWMIKPKFLGGGDFAENGLALVQIKPFLRDLFNLPARDPF